MSGCLFEFKYAAAVSKTHDTKKKLIKMHSRCKGISHYYPIMITMHFKINDFWITILVTGKCEQCLREFNWSLN